MEVKCLHLQVSMKMTVLLTVCSLHFRNDKKIRLLTQDLLHYLLKHTGTVSFSKA